MSVRRAWLALIAALLSGTARAEDAGFLLEPTYALPAPLFLRGGRSVDGESPRRVPYTLDASIAPHLPLGSNLGELAQRDGLAHAVTFTPRVELRHGRGASYPIRTPSFYPSVRVQVFHQRTRPGLRRRYVLEALLAHHSNGQDGCLYADEQRAGERCVSEEPRATGRRPLNHRDGSFSSNELGLRLGLELARAQGGVRDTLSAMLGGVSFRPHSLGLDPALARVYGEGRVEAALDLRRSFAVGSARERSVALHVRASARVGGPHVRTPFALTLDVRGRFARAYGWGPVLRAHLGSDPYNVRFDVPIALLALGAMWRG